LHKLRKKNGWDGRGALKRKKKKAPRRPAERGGEKDKAPYKEGGTGARAQEEECRGLEKRRRLPVKGKN